MSECVLSINAVSRKTGLTPHVIRVWERRYSAVKPCRTDTNRRLYSDAEVERLTLLRSAIAAGHSIGNIAALSDERLKAIAGEVQTTREVSPGPPGSAVIHIHECLAAIRALDTRGLEQALAGAIVSLGPHGFLERVIGPLAQRLGDLWRDGSLMAAHEHFASAVIRSFLSSNAKPFAQSGSAPLLVVATPPGQLHELGAAMVAAAAADLGWRVVYLGASLPACEIAGVAARNHARAVALSIVYPEDDPQLANELRALRRYLPPEIALIAGGRAARNYDVALKSIRAARPKCFAELYRCLDRLRAGSQPRLDAAGAHDAPPANGLV